MGLVDLFLVAVGLSMDAFAVAICKGLSMNRLTFKNALTVGLYFGIFQALMPLIGYSLGAQFADRITAYDHWIAFILLGIIGGKMIKDSFDRECPDEADGQASVSTKDMLSFKAMLPLAIATSIDALAVGVTFAFLNIRILPAACFIGVTTLILSCLGVLAGKLAGTRFKSKAELLGGGVLVLIGVKTLIEHLAGG